jgi:hypothetical protein
MFHAMHAVSCTLGKSGKIVRGLCVMVWECVGVIA